MKILVTGGTGFLGSRLVQTLVDGGHDVAVFSRRVHEDVPDYVTVCIGDIRDKNALRAAMQGAQIVYHLAINLDENDPEMHDTNVKGARNVADLCKELKVRQLIYMSSSGVLGETHGAAKENMPYNPGTAYEKSKMESEKIIMASGVTFTIVRTTIIIGPNMIWAQIFEAAKRGYPVIGSGNNHFHLVYVEDVVKMLALVCNNGRAANQVFHIASPDANTYEEVYKIIAQELGVPMTSRHVPLFLAYLASYAHTFKRRMQGRKPSLIKARSSIDRLVRDRLISIEKARTVLGYAPRYDTRNAVRETIKYLRIARLGYSGYDISEIQKVKDKGKI